MLKYMLKDLLISCITLAVITLIGALTTPALAGDPTGYWRREAEAGRAPPLEWWGNLASAKGLCCSFADGFKIEDVDWDSENDHYRVRLHGEWIDVPDSALVKEPNRYGPSVVWPYMDAIGATQIRCFLPGAGS